MSWMSDTIGGIIRKAVPQRPPIDPATSSANTARPAPAAPPANSSAVPPPHQPPAPTSQAPGGSGTTGKPATTSGIGDAGKALADGSQLKKGINDLNSDGDRAIWRLTPEAKAQVNLRGVKVGPKAQLGSQITVTRNGDNDATASYTVRYDKQSLGALAAEVGSGTLGKGRTNGAGGKSVDGTLKAEVGVQGVDAVEMRFSNKADAQRAADTLQRLQLADTGQDAVDLALSSAMPGPLGAAMPKPSSLSGGGQNPVGNPLTRDGAPGNIANRLAGVSQDDLNFLHNNISAYEQTVGSRSRLAAEVKGDLKLLDGALEGRIDGTQRVSRRVEMPTDTQDGSVTYSLSGGVRLSAKERATRKLEKMTGGVLALKDDNRLELASGTTTASLRYTIPKGTDPAASAGGRPMPEADALSGKAPLKLDRITIENDLRWQDQSVLDLSRGDHNRLTETLTVDNPDQLKPAADKLFSGDYRGAAETAGAKLDIVARDVRSSGTDTQPGVKVDLKIADVEATAIVTTGVDDVTGTRRLTVQPGTPATPGDPGTPPGTRLETPPAPTDDGKTLAVVPYLGAQVRDTPAGQSRGVIQSGSFVRDEGERRTDAGGNDWTRVSGTDENDAPVTGWVRSDLLARHDSAKGAMDERGRINPTNEHNQMDQITVKKDDNLHDIAREHGWDFKETLAANKDHLRNPSLIFKGDTVYVPGSARGPRKVAVETPGKPPEPGTPGTPSVTTESTGNPESKLPGTGSGTGSGTGPAPAPGGKDRSAPGAGSAEGTPESQPEAGANPKPGAGDTAGRPDLDQILRDYQVRDDERVMYTPKLGPLPIEVPGMKPREMSKTEADLLDKLGSNHGLLGLKNFSDISSNDPNDPGLAYREADRQFPREKDGQMIPGAEDGHNDAFRHAYWNALMSDRFGQDFAAAMGSAHEGVEGNPGAKEAMDLYNNEVGRRIAADNPGASDEELAGKVADAVRNGEMLVIDQKGNLAWSDQVAVGETGSATGEALPGENAPPAYESK